MPTVQLEFTISQQQGEIRQLKDKLTSHDSAAKRAIATLQSEMKDRIDQVSIFPYSATLYAAVSYTHLTLPTS